MTGSEVRPRYARITVLGVSVVVTGTAVLGGLGVLPSGGSPSYAAGEQAPKAAAARVSLTAAEEPISETPDDASDASDASDAADEAEVEGSEVPPVPADSGEGRRVVFDQGAQRVWLVRRDGSVARTYLVSGSIYDNLQPAPYSVFSRSKRAWGVDGSELRYMVRFTTGTEAAIGFHNIPVLDGEKVQTRDQLGTPLSHGCVRQQGSDAMALWEFAPLGTAVVVVDTTADITDSSAAG